MKRILIVSYLFPPMGGIAVQRALSLAKYLPGCGYEVHILTAPNAAGPVYDPGLLKSVPSEVRLHNALTVEIPFAWRQKVWKWADRKPKPKSQAAQPKMQAADLTADAAERKPQAMEGNASAAPEQKATAVARGRAPRKSLMMGIAQRLLCPEPEVLWAPWATRKAKQIVRRHKIDVVLVTAPPFSAFLVGNAIKREFPQIRLVSDFRDEWLKFYLNNNDFQNNPHARKRAPQIERETVRCSDLVVAVNESSLSEIRARYPEESAAKFVCVPNGYDPEVFDGVPTGRHTGDGIVVAHGGTVYKNASPRYYLDALDALPTEIRSQIETWFVGRIANEEQRYVRERKCAIRIFDFLPQKEALAELSKADYLLLTMTDPISVPGKLYEYLALGKPILAFAPADSEVSRLLEQTGAGWRLDPERPAECQALLKEIFSRSKAAPRLDSVAVRRYERPNLVAEYSARIDAVA